MGKSKRAKRVSDPDRTVERTWGEISEISDEEVVALAKAVAANAERHNLSDQVRESWDSLPADSTHSTDNVDDGKSDDSDMKDVPAYKYAEVMIRVEHPDGPEVYITQRVSLEDLGDCVRDLGQMVGDHVDEWF